MTTRTDVPRRRMSRDDRGRQLLEVAGRVLQERGFQAASMDEIAERAGVTKPVLYHHFGSKDGLLAAVIDRAGAELRERVAAAVREASDPQDALTRGVRAYFIFIGEHSPAWSRLLNEAVTATPAAEAVEAARREQAEFIAAAIAAELPGGDIERARLYAQVVVGAAERLAFHGDVNPGLTPDELTAALMDVMWAGFAGLRAGERWRHA